MFRIRLIVRFVNINKNEKTKNMYFRGFLSNPNDSFELYFSKILMGCLKSFKMRKFLLSCHFTQELRLSLSLSGAAFARVT